MRSLCAIFPRMRPSGEDIDSIAQTDVDGLNSTLIDGSPSLSTYCATICPFLAKSSINSFDATNLPSSCEIGVYEYHRHSPNIAMGFV